MFGRIRPEFQCLEGYGRNSKVWKDRKRIAVFKRIRPEIQRLEEKGQIRIFGRIR